MTTNTTIETILNIETILDSATVDENNAFCSLFDFVKLNPAVKCRIGDFFNVNYFPKKPNKIKGVKKIIRQDVINISDIYISLSTQNRVGKQIDHKNVETISRSIDDDGWDYYTEQIAVEEGDFTDPETGKKYKYRLVNGHHRLLAIFMKYCTCPVVVVEFEDDYQRELFARITSNRSRTTCVSKPYTFQDAHYMIKRAQELGRLENELKDVESFVKENLRDLCERKDLSARKVAEMLCSSVGIVFKQHTWTKKTMESVLAEHHSGIDDNGNPYRNYAVQGNFDSNGEMGFACCVDHSSNLDNFSVNYFKALVANEQEFKKNGKKVTNVFSGFQRENESGLPLDEFKRQCESALQKRLKEVAEGAILWYNGEGGRINHKWLACDAETESLDKFY